MERFEKKPFKEVRVRPTSKIIDLFVKDIQEKFGKTLIEPQDIKLEFYDYGFFAQNKRQAQNFFQHAFAIGNKTTTGPTAKLFVYPAYDDTLENIVLMGDEPKTPKEKRGK